jgi:hypothetical protein
MLSTAVVVVAGFLPQGLVLWGGAPFMEVVEVDVVVEILQRVPF